jgi:hypothetical protein
MNSSSSSFSSLHAALLPADAASVKAGGGSSSVFPFSCDYDKGKEDMAHLYTCHILAPTFISILSFPLFYSSILFHSYSGALGASPLLLFFTFITTMDRAVNHQ